MSRLGTLGSSNHNCEFVGRQERAKFETGIPLIQQEFPVRLVWSNIGLFAVLHAMAMYGLYLFLTGQILWQTIIWGIVFGIISGLGITAGCHRLWAHKSYKAKLPLRLILTVFQTIAFQNSIHEWCRDHRLHHKYSETNADPHNPTRGFLFAHIGWLLSRKHPAVKEKGAGIDMSDLEADPIIMFQKRFYVPITLTISFFIPTLIPMYLWGETLTVAWCYGVQLRYCLVLHYTWLVNSLAHLWGDRPYDKNINPGDNKLVTILTLGEGWHNYHHTFPWDYKAAELGSEYNWTTAFIDLMAKIGWAYDLKSVSQDAIMRRVKRTGDGSHRKRHNQTHTPVLKLKPKLEGALGHLGPWGWGDEDIPAEDMAATETFHPGK